MSADLGGPLAGLRVVDLSEGVAAAFAAKLLADLGADVLMVEPLGGHPLRAQAPRRVDGLSARFVYLSAGKRSVIDDEVPALLAEADLLLTDRDPAQVARLTAELSSLPVVSVRPFGSTGPKAGHRAHHLTVFHASGESSTLPSGLGWELFPERAPLQLGSDMGLFDAGWNAAVAALAVCFEGAAAAQRVDVSVQESLLTLSRTRLNRFLNEGVLVGREKNRYGIYGMLRCADGWAQVVGMRPEHWDRLLSMPEGAEFAERGFATAEERAADLSGLGKVLADWCVARPKGEVAQIMSGLGAPAGVFAEPTDLLASEQLAHREFFRLVGDGAGGTLRLPGAPYRFSGTPLPVRPAPEVGFSTGFSSRDPQLRPARPGRLLEGVRVLDFTWAAAGPYATLLLGFLGAEVVKIESGSRLDPARSGFLARYDGVDRSPVFNELNLNKRSVAMDLTQPESVAIVRKLVSEADVVVDNFRPGVMERRGFGPAALLALNPRVVVASSSANGSTGPDALGAGLASIFSATGGLSAQTGYEDGPPTEVGDPVDYRSGTSLAVGILAALFHRERTGEGQHVDVSSREVVIASAPDAFLAHELGAPWQERMGNGHREASSHGVYASQDGWVAVAAIDGDEQSVLEQVLGASSLEAWVGSRSAAAAAELLQAAGVPAEPVMTFAALAEDPHLLARDAFVTVEHPELGAQQVLRPPWSFSAGGCGIHSAGPRLGADTLAVVGEDAVPEARRAEVFR